jgi:hypothetical protein
MTYQFLYAYWFIKLMLLSRQGLICRYVVFFRLPLSGNKSGVLHKSYRPNSNYSDRIVNTDYYL